MGAARRPRSVLPGRQAVRRALEAWTQLRPRVWLAVRLPRFVPVVSGWIARKPPALRADFQD
eukprot:13477946-Alexandrium_andersonii.AAC.1